MGHGPSGLLACTGMADPKQIPELATELFDMSKEYLRQETLEPAKRLGAFAGFALGGSFLLAAAAIFAVLGAYSLLQLVLPEGAWYLVLARGLTALAAGIGVGLIGWRMAQ